MIFGESKGNNYFIRYPINQILLSVIPSQSSQQRSNGPFLPPYSMADLDLGLPTKDSGKKAHFLHDVLISESRQAGLDLNSSVFNIE